MQAKLAEDGEGEDDPFRLSARDLDLREIIGTGAFGRVHTAKWRNTPVAVKVLFHDCSRDDVDMFHKEIRLMARLHHPNIAQFLGYAKLGPDEWPDAAIAAISLSRSGGGARAHPWRRRWRREGMTPQPIRIWVRGWRR